MEAQRQGDIYNATAGWLRLRTIGGAVQSALGFKSGSHVTFGI